MREINNSFKIAMNKPNIGIVTFQNIQMAKYHISKNLDVGAIVDSSVPNTI